VEYKKNLIVRAFAGIIAGKKAIRQIDHGFFVAFYLRSCTKK